MKPILCNPYSFLTALVYFLSFHLINVVKNKNKNQTNRVCSSVYLFLEIKNIRIVQNVDSTSTLYEVSLIEFCTHAFIAVIRQQQIVEFPTFRHSLAHPRHLSMPLNVIFQIQKRKACHRDT